MPISGYTNGVAATVLVALLLVPVQYYIPDLQSGLPEPAPAPPSAYSVSWAHLDDYPKFDIIVAITFVLLVFAIFICDWIQRKLLERRVLKLNKYLQECIENICSWDARQEQLETMMQTVRSATAEYSLLLFLVLRKHRLAPHKGPPSCRFGDKILEDFIPFVKNSEL
ncbi:uncharacterized protein LOC106715805 [Papilio machaon]|uniref:uncharacterized protein LOC106715805 n=1 Tax=Papilio machaon TaxID=76193 RepID=UPI001E6635B7|nr:uncharacterized protein LOC106715805 [Papilio machaon]